MTLHAANIEGDVMMDAVSFERDGFAIVHQALSGAECNAVDAHVAGFTGITGTRCLLSLQWCKALAQRLRSDESLASFIPADFVAVQCTYFEKSHARNWAVPLHQDLSIPVAERVDHSSLRGWSLKEGTLFVQAPADLLQQLVAVRLHVDACTEADGPLRVVAGSHRTSDGDSHADSSHAEIMCTGDRGSVLLMRPLLLHGSAKATGASRRRVLHFLYGPAELPYGLRWPRCPGTESIGFGHSNRTPIRRPTTATASQIR